MICLLRIGFDDADEPNDAIVVPVTERLGNYRIEHRDDGSLWELGRGAMGVTYRAVDTSLQRAVALKLIDSEWVKRGAEARERFMREARAAASLRHPNVAAVYQFGIQEENGQYFCAMELVEGETLEMRVRRTGPLDALTTVEIGLQVSSALAAAEKKGLVHRDLKPANLMVLDEKNDGEEPAVAGTDRWAVRRRVQRARPTIKVIDFGVAKALVEKPDAMGLTHAGFVGTPAFASPEQFTNAPVDVRSDIYSLGATLWYLLTGHMLFPGASVEEIRASQQLHALPIKQLKAARVPGRLISLIVSMLAAEPAARPGVRTLTSKLQECRAQLLDRWKVARRFAFAAGLIGITAAAFVLFAHRQNRTTSQNAAHANVSEKTIAVLPFESLSEDKSNAYFASGVRDEILTKLAQVRGLKVMSRSSSKKNESRPANLAELGRQLGTDTFLEGSVQKVSEDLLIRVQLIDAKTGAQVWAQSYQSSRQAISEVEGEVAHQVADALNVKLAPGEAQRLRLAATNNPRAHDSYLRARALSAHSDEKSHEEQIALLREAVAEDPQYAVAWAELAGAYVHIGDAYRAPREILTPARDAAEKAVALDEKLATGHMVLAGIALTYDWNFPLAKREFERAIALDPDSSDAHRLYGWYLARAERNFVAARQEMAKARTLDPFYTWPLWAESSVAIAQGDHESALRLAERVIEINPQFLYDEDPIAHVYVAMERWQDAVKRYESIPAARYNRPNFELAICYARTGQTARARQILGDLEALAQRRYVDHTYLAGIHAALGDKDKAFAALEQALKDRSARVYAARFYPWLASLRDDPRFIELENKVTKSQLPSSSEFQASERSIAVLPFDNLSDDQASVYFALGIQDDILVNLSRIRDLKVISRTSVMQYKSGNARNLREIGKELGVAHLLEGSVQREAGKVRIHAQLIDARTDAHLWAQTYDRDLANVFAIQSEIAQAIAGQLQARLSPTEKAAIEQRPTSDLAAFDLYTRAKALRFTSNFSKAFEKNNLLQAVDLLNEAVKRDPAFFLAWCELSGTHDTLYSSGYDRTPARLSLGDAAVQTALRLRPDAGEAHLRLAHHLYETLLDYDGARAELAIAHRTLPNHPQTFQLAGNIDRHQGRWNESIRNLERAIELDPRNFNLLQNVAWTYHVLRRYREMVVLLDRALAITPKDRTALVNRGLAELDWRADVRPLRNTVAAILAEDPAAAAAFANTSMLIALCERDLDAAVRALEALPGSSFGPGILQMNRACTEGLIARVRGDAGAAHAAFSTARVQQEELIRSQPDNAPAIAVLGLIDAGLNRKEDALREGRRAMELMPVAQDSTSGAMMIQNFATICAWVGEKELALQQLETATRTPGMLSYGQLKLLPEWDPLRGDPRFEAIVASLAPK